MLENFDIVADFAKKKIQEKGFEVFLFSDFKRLEKVSSANGWKVTPHFSVAENTFFRNEAFWIGIYDGDRCVATVAFKYQALGPENLAQYSTRYWPRVYKRGSENKIKFAKRQKKQLESMRGNLIYCGEFKVLDEYQGTGIGRWLAHYAKVAAFRKWMETEWFYIYMERKDVERGLMGVIQLSISIANALNWESHPSQAQSDYVLGGLHVDDFYDWLRDMRSSVSAQGSTKL